MQLSKGMHLMCVHPDGNAKCPSKAKVSYLDNALIIDKQVLWFQIPMQHTPLVAEQDALEQLKVKT